MDERVRQAMARWPNVPAVWGWLRLDRRGRWLLIDRGRADFDESRHGGGEPITNPQIVEFIARNYQADAQGCWFWQNGPQRAFVDLDLAPLVYRVFGEAPAQRLVTHTGCEASVIEQVFADEAGDLYVVTDCGPGTIDDRDIAQLELTLQDSPAEPAAGPQAVCGELSFAGAVHAIRPMAAPAPQLLGFVRRPRPAQTS
ncbi:MAG TPA: DUF2946 family protein [Burkholderiaceae bacterium]|nr:DUF2946 family protein [Burkholderiaceae bacterium]